MKKDRRSERFNGLLLFWIGDKHMREKRIRSFRSLRLGKWPVLTLCSCGLRGRPGRVRRLPSWRRRLLCRMLRSRSLRLPVP